MEFIFFFKQNELDCRLAILKKKLLCQKIYLSPILNIPHILVMYYLFEAVYTLASIASFLLTALFFGGLFITRFKFLTIPKQLSTKPVSAYSLPLRDPLRHGYSRKKIPKDVDVIVIGSGMGGLTCAGLLAKVGKKVLVLEQHYIAGGCTHAYEDQGFEFDTGLHYIGNIHKRQAILDLIVDRPIVWDDTCPSNGAYDVFLIDGVEYRLRPGRGAFLQEVAKHFQDDTNAVQNAKAYLDYVEKTAQHSLFFHLKLFRYPTLAKWLNWWLNTAFFDSTRQSALSVVQRFTDNPKLQSFLCGQWGGYGATPDKQSFFLHASYVHHYLNGAWYPRGGCSEIARRIVPTIYSSGGAVLVRKKVQRIIVEKGMATGVEMSNGDIISAKYIVSAVGARNLWNSLVPQEVVPPVVKQRLESVGPSSSMLYFTVGLHGSPEDLHLPSSNLWVTPTVEDWKVSGRSLLDPNLPMFIGFPCAKDSTWNSRYPGKSTAVIILMADYKEFEKWDNTSYHNRPLGYTTLKAQLIDHLLEVGLFRHFPQLRHSVAYTKLGTPLTFNHFIGTSQGECYGMDNHCTRFQEDDWLRPQTKIPGLYMTGHDLMTMGVTGALMGGVLTAHAVLGYGTILDVVTGRNLIQDLINIKK